jgi:hypothetical protein
MADPLSGLEPGDAVASVAHIIQVALTPVFLLSGIGTLLNVFNTRLSRVSDQTEHTTDLMSTEDDALKRSQLGRHLDRLHRRRLVLDAAVVLGAIGGSATCGAAFVLFLGGLRESAIATWLVVLFGVALGCTVGALMAFLVDSVLAWHGIHRDGPLPRRNSG